MQRLGHVIDLVKAALDPISVTCVYLANASRPPNETEFRSQDPSYSIGMTIRTDLRPAEAAMSFSVCPSPTLSTLSVSGLASSGLI